MSQYPPPNPPSPYPGWPPHPVSRPRDPRAVARRASVLMWVLGSGFVLVGICGAALLLPLMEWVVTKSPPEQAAQAREQMRQLEAQGQQHGISLSTNLLISGLVIIAVGGTLGALAFGVRGGGQTAAVVAAVVTGLILGLVLLQMLGAVLVGGGPGVMAACMMLVPGGLLVLLMVWLIQVARAAPQAASSHVPAQQGHWPSQAHRAPPGAPPTQAPGYPPPNWGAPPAGHGFQPPAPPPGQPPVQFGYATRPPPAQPPPAQPQQQQPSPPQDPPEGGAPA